MDVDALLDLPTPHARVAERRARKQEEERRQAALTTSQTPTPTAAPPLSQSPHAPSSGRPMAAPTSFFGATAGQVPKDDEARIVLALDYGTTFTGVAYAWSVGQPITADEIYVVQNWPGASSLKVPSEFSYSTTKRRAGNFGYDIDEDAKVLSKTKLDLLDSKDRGRELTTFTEVLHGLATLRLNDDAYSAGEIPEHLYKTAEDVVKDYLEKIASVTLKDMEERLTKTAVHQTPIDMIITHPANWQKSARNKTYRAAIAAFEREFEKELRNVSFVSEPEACAHYTLNEAQVADHARFRKGDCVVVVDAGGGTVDLASFQITNIDSNQGRFEMKGVGKITGVACGSTFVDEAFMKLLKDRLGPVDSEKIVGTGPYGDGGHYIWTKAGRDVFRDFIPIKHDFAGSLPNPFTTVDLPRFLDIQDRVDKGIRNGKLQLTAEDIQDIFRDPLAKIKSLVLRQIGALKRADEQYRVKSVFLSGGFAQSPYLFSMLSNCVGQQSSDMTVERGLDCWSAVSKGAVMKGLGLLTEKPTPIVRCPCHLGIKTRRSYAPWLKTNAGTEIDSLGVPWTTDQVEWFVRKNDAIDPDGLSTHHQYRCHWLVPEGELEPQAINLPPAARSSSLWSRRRDAADPQDNVPKMEPGPRSVLRDVVVVCYSAEHASMGFKELTKDSLKTTTLLCDLTKAPSESKTRYTAGNKRYIKVGVEVNLEVSADKFIAKVTSGNKLVSPVEYIDFQDVH